jgi:hypothetical protein
MIARIRTGWCDGAVPSISRMRAFLQISVTLMHEVSHAPHQSIYAPVSI